MKRTRSFLSGLLFLVFFSLLVFFILNTLSKFSHQDGPETTAVDQTIELVAIGDSLTEGVGDSSASGGYVPRVAKLLEEDEGISKVHVANFGIAGETSEQILQRVETNTAIKDAITEAEIVVYTLGGNDVIKTFKKELLNVQLDSFTEPLATYQKNLTSLLQKTQEWNPDAVVYVFGIYNPYEIYFSEIEEMQLIVDKWNQTTKKLAESFPQMYYIPIDTAFTSTRVLSDSNLESNTSTEKEAYQNPYLYEEDLFHPNDTGYSKMAAILYKEIEKEKPIWINK